MTGWRGSAVWVPQGGDRERLWLHPIALLSGRPVGDIVMQLLGESDFGWHDPELRAAHLGEAFGVAVVWWQPPRSHVEPAQPWDGRCPCLRDDCWGPRCGAIDATLTTTTLPVLAVLEAYDWYGNRATKAQAADRPRDPPPHRKRKAKRSRWTRAWRDELRARDAARRAQRNEEVSDAA